MTSKSVDLPEPFGPMMPTSSPLLDVEGDVAVRGDAAEALGDAGDVDAGSRRPARAAGTPPQPLADPGHQSLGREPHHHDEGGAVDDQVDPDEAGADAPEARAQVRLQRRE